MQKHRWSFGRLKDNAFADKEKKSITFALQENYSLSDARMEVEACSICKPPKIKILIRKFGFLVGDMKPKG